ncbi:helix-turn-helix domain-containing protein [Coprobacillus cateniformis]|uniref:helix-turn-helix domain-containing protein n=1 Tax=Coprobacillus cateniformis TaxID=100884 RepID=UPI0034A30D2A
MKKEKIKAILSLKGLNMTDLAHHLNKSKQQISNKNKSDVWNLDEAIQIATLTNTKLAFIDQNNNPLIIFDENDIKQEENND